MAGPLSVTITRGDDLAGCGVGAVSDEPIPQQRLGGPDGALEGSDEVCGALDGRDRARQDHLGGVVHHRAQPPDALGCDLELGEVRLPDPVAAHRRLDEGLPACGGELAALGLISHRLQQASARHGPLDARRRAHIVTIGGGDRRDLAISPRRPGLGVLGHIRLDEPHRVPATAPWADPRRADAPDGRGRCAAAPPPAPRTSRRCCQRQCGSSRGPRRREILRPLISLHQTQPRPEQEILTRDRDAQCGHLRD